MHLVQPCALPDGALLETYRQGGAYADCYTTTVPRAVPLADFIAAFYATALFRLERTILAYAVNKPSSDEALRAMAHGERDHFAAWTVEQRRDDQILLADYRGRTRSWLMCTAFDGAATRLYFGSAVVPRSRTAHEGKRFSAGFSVLLVFHKAYSAALLYGAKRALMRAVP